MFSLPESAQVIYPGQFLSSIENARTTTQAGSDRDESFEESFIHSAFPGEVPSISQR